MTQKSPWISLSGQRRLVAISHRNTWAPAAQRDYFAGSNSGVGDGRGGFGILVRQGVCDVGDVVEKFTGDPPGARGTSRIGSSSSERGPTRRPTHEFSCGVATSRRWSRRSATGPE